MTATAIGTTWTGTIAIDAEWCCSCGVPFGMAREYMEKKRRDHSTFHCPNGHAQHYTGETEEARLKRQLKYANDERARITAERDQIEASRRAYKGQATKLRNRALAGECPVCGQHLRDLARHMGRQHPDEKPETEGLT